LDDLESFDNSKKGVLRTFIPDNFIVEIIDHMKRENTIESEATQAEIVAKQ